MLKKFCIDNNIKFLHGLPYRPHSQGVVERVHRVIKKGLLCHKEDLKDKYNINYTLDEVINIKMILYVVLQIKLQMNYFLKIT